MDSSRLLMFGTLFIIRCAPSSQNAFEQNHDVLLTVHFYFLFYTIIILLYVNLN